MSGSVSSRPRPEPKQYRGTVDPIALFKRLRDDDVLGAYSYLHISPDQAEIGWNPIDHLRLLTGSPDGDWRKKLARFADRAAELGSKAFGYVGFDAVDSHSGTLPDESQTGRPLVEFIIPGELITIRDGTIVYQSATGRDLEAYLSSTKPAASPGATAPPLTPASQTHDHAYVTAVRKGIAEIASGQAKKLVLSRYKAFDVDFDPIRLFASLPSSFVDGFLVCFGDLVAVIPSPELLLSGADGQVVTNPLAGTRPRGRTEAEDDRLSEELRDNHKEIVEHVISVRSVLSDLEPVCAPGTLVVSRFMEVVRQPKVQHLSSIIQGRRNAGGGVLDALWALFPAVTVAGIPRKPAIAAMRGLESGPRYLYAGVMGWVTGKNDCRFSLALRGIVRCGGRSFIQAGAGVLTESVPEAELSETAHKLAAMEEALARAVAAQTR